MKRANTLAVLLLLGLLGLHAALLVTADAGASEPEYVVEEATITGGGYHLSSLTWRILGTATGGSYRLLAPEEPSLRGSGCCCTYLPCTLRDQ